MAESGAIGCLKYAMEAFMEVVGISIYSRRIRISLENVR